MPETYRVSITLNAATELAGIFQFIGQDSPQNAAAVISRLLDAMDSLDTFPKRHKLIKDTHALGVPIRSMPVRPYLVRYHVDDVNRVVTILSVRHGARRPPGQ
jgi:plasmid stabilization system protein ParE